MRRGKRVSEQGVQLIFTQNSLSVSRFAFVVPKSVDKRAVGRNRLRRYLRESVRLTLPRIAAGLDGVFLIRKKMAAEEILRKAGLV